MEAAALKNDEAVGGVALIVDDDAEYRQALRRVLENSEYTVREAGDGLSAMDIISSEPVDVVLLDVMMPGLDGFETCRRIRAERRFGHIPVVFVTAHGERDSRVEGKAAGADDFLVKPIDSLELLARVRNLVLVRRYYQHLERERKRLRQEVLEQSDLIGAAMVEVSNFHKTLRHFHEEIILRLSRAVEFRDDETANHVQRMSRYCKLIATKVGLPEERCEAIRLTSALHDVGKIATPDGILHKPGRLTDDEMGVMRKHSAIGHRMLAGSNSDLLELAAMIAWTHHERYDGGGYPRGLSGEEIPLEGRIAAVADVFDALTSPRVYKPAMPMPKAIEIMMEERGRQFDPEMLDVFLGALDDVREIRMVYADR